MPFLLKKFKHALSMNGKFAEFDEKNENENGSMNAQWKNNSKTFFEQLIFFSLQLFNS